MSEEPDYQNDPEAWRKWIRGKLGEMANDAAMDDRARVNAAKALVDSLDRQLEPKAQQTGSQAPSHALPAPTGDPLERLKQLPLAEAKAEVARGRLIFEEAERYIEEQEAKGE